MSEKLRYPLFFLSVMILIGSCVEPFIAETEEDMPIVVSCLIIHNPEQSESTQHLDLFYAKPKGVGENVPIEDASVRLFATQQQYEFAHVGNGRWESTVPVKTNDLDSYVLKIDVPGHETITAKTSVPHPFEILPGTYIPGTIVLSDHIKNAHGESYSPSHKLWIFAHKDASHNVSYPYMITSNAFADDFNVTSLRFGDVDYSAIPDEDYASFWSIKRAKQNNIPEAPLHEGGFIRIDLPDNYDNCLDLDSRHGLYLGSSSEFMVEAAPLECKGNRITGEEHLCILGVSDEYDRFLREAFSHWGKINHDLASLYSYDNIYTNIQGGFGIFGACCIVTMDIY